MNGLLALQKRLTNNGGKAVYWRSEQLEKLALLYNVSKSDLAGLTIPTPAAPAPMMLDDVVKKSGVDGGKTFVFVASDNSVDRAGDSIDPKGWKLDAFKAAGSPLLYAHNASNLPIGKVASIGVQGGKLLARVRFAPTSMGQKVQQLVEGDHGLAGVSVGFVPISFSMSRDVERHGGLDFAEQELLELSVTPTPANRNAVLQRESTPAERKAERAAELSDLQAKAAQWRREGKAIEAKAAAEAAAKKRAYERRKQEILAEAEAQRRAKLSPEERRRELIATTRRIAGGDAAFALEQRLLRREYGYDR